MQNKAGPFRIHETSLQRVVLGGQMEQLLHHGLGRGETEGRGAAHDPRRISKSFYGPWRPRVVMEVGRHSAEARDVVGVWEHEVLVANPRKNGRATRRFDGVRNCGRPPRSIL